MTGQEDEADGKLTTALPSHSSLGEAIAASGKARDELFGASRELLSIE